MKDKLKKAYMKTAATFAELSYAKRLHVGAIIVKDDRIISIGYNGMPTGWDNTCEITLPEEIDIDSRTIIPAQLVTRPEVLHAESNAVSKVARSTESSEGATLFCTHAPCIDCAKLIYQAGIKSVYYGENYRSDAGILFLIASNVHVEQLSIN